MESLSVRWAFVHPAVAAGEEHSLVLCSDGSIVAFGANTYGELGTGTNSHSSISVSPVSSGTIRVEFFRRRNSPIVYTPKRSNSPGSFVPMTGTPVVTVIDADWERVVVEEPVGTPAPSQHFVVVAVTLP